jgi:putative RecB family exonuclease
MYLKDQVVIVDTPTDQTMRGLRHRAVAVWAAIERGCATESFKPNRSALCKTCAFQAYCPEFGGDPDRARCGD